MRDRQIIYKHGYGMADLDHDIPIGPNTVFHVASVSKQFTAAAILLLAQDGKLSLDDDVRKYLPEVPDFGARITIANLIYHTSGLPDQWDLLDLAGWRYSLDVITDDDVLGLVSRWKDLNFKPGDEELYSNTEYTLLGQIVKRVSGQSLREFTTNRIFRPLGMNDTHFRDDHTEIVKHIAYGYTGTAAGGFRLYPLNFDTGGATGLLTTVEDLAKWDDNFDHPRVGGPLFVQQQLQRGKLNSGKELDYAAGLELGKYRGLSTIEHAGTDAGYRSELLRFPDQHFSVACLCNNRDIFPVEIAREVADIYLEGQFAAPAFVRPESTAKGVDVPLPLLTQYAGLYWRKGDSRIERIVLRDGKLFGFGIEMMPLTESHFQLTVDPEVTFTFAKAAGDVPQRVTIKEGTDPPYVLDLSAGFRPTPAQLAEYSGSYISDAIDPVFRVSIQNGSVMLNRPKLKPQRLTPLSEDYFSGLGGIVHFSKDQSGSVTGFVLSSENIRNFPFRKAGASK
jgi:CubicO group peptidase (beta-lactamase class C family)